MNAVSVEPAGTICMALPHGIGRILAPRIVEAYQQRCPKVKLNLVEVAGRAEDAAVSRVDLCIVYNLRQSSEFVAKPLLSERLVVIAPRRTTAGELIPYPDSYRCADLAKLKLILPSHNHGLRLNIDQAFASQNIEVEPVLEVDGFSILKRLVESGSGYTIMTASPAYFELASGALAAIPIVSPSLSLELQLVYRRDKTVSRALSELIAVTEQQMAIFAGTNGHFSARPRRRVEGSESRRVDHQGVSAGSACLVGLSPQAIALIARISLRDGSGGDKIESNREWARRATAGRKGRLSRGSASEPARRVWEGCDEGTLERVAVAWRGMRRPLGYGRDVLMRPFRLLGAGLVTRAQRHCAAQV